MGEAGHPTLVSDRRAQLVEERRAAYERLLFVACFVWPPFGVLDVLGARIWHHDASVPALVTLRLIGSVLLVVAYGAVRWGGLGAGALTTLDVSINALLGIFISIIGVEHGGLDSRDFAGIILVVVARSGMVPSHWLRALLCAAACALMWPAVIAIESAFVPDLRAQWANPRSMGDFVYGMLFIAGALALCTAASNAQWKARLQVHHARRLGNYRLKMRIGSGGNGDVWIARQEALGRDVALKVLRERGELSEEKIRRFEREARAAASLTHPNTIRIYEFGASDEGVLFIAMELLDGLDVDALVEVAGPLPAARATKLVRQACASLAEAHVKKIVHRDIKPANFFVTQAGEDYDFIKLLDFGVARVTEAQNPSLTETGILFGTPAYMSPEVCAGERASTRSDVYSLGAVLYYMLTGTQLFPDRTFAETVMSHISRTPELPSTRLGKPLPEGLELIVMKCLQKKREDRFRSVRELDEALSGVKDLGEWTKEDARSWWTGARPSVALRARGAA
ncbi:MAG TPA: serine/threonine-protein kinase [Polyangiaceae bacterium]|jgi:serine/threonine-protein kinase